MAARSTYLELSEDDGSSHKFYEVVLDGLQVTISYGRIGEPGQSKVSAFATAEKAEAAAAKKIAETRNRG